MASGGAMHGIVGYRSSRVGDARSAARGPWRLIALLALLLGLLALPPAAHGAGELDPSFDGDGTVLTDFGALDVANGVAIQADGKIVAAGGSVSGSFALARYNPDGSLDPTFDGDGRVLTDFGLDFDVASGIAIQADGKIVAAGTSGEFDAANFALARYNPDGSLDPTFDGDGRVLTDFGARDEGFDVAIQADGKIVAAGFSDAGANPHNFALARYLPDGATPLPTSKAQCKNGGHAQFGFKNQGQCVAFVQRGSKP